MNNEQQVYKYKIKYWSGFAENSRKILKYKLNTAQHPQGRGCPSLLKPDLTLQFEFRDSGLEKTP
jgi:hypothetical protein